MILKEVLSSLKPNQALLHYNIATIEQFKAGIEAVQETRIPLIFGVSEGERAYLGMKWARELVSEYQAPSSRLQAPIFLNADHCKSVESVQQAIEAEFDAVLFDGSELPFPDNILRTKEIISYSRQLAAGRRELPLVEGELGYLPGHSDIEGEIEIKPEFLTNPEEAEKFVSETKVNLLAVSVGNVHGIPAGVKHSRNADLRGLTTWLNAENDSQQVLNKAQLDFTRIQQINSVLKDSEGFFGLVLHGGSGLNDEDFTKAIQAGIKIIHLNTEFRQIWKESLIRELNQKTVVPYKIYQGVIEALAKRIVYYQRLFWS